MALWIVGTYLLRPDAVVIPGLAMLPCLLRDRRRTLLACALAGTLLAACLVLFRLYYGTALPLAFYVKSYWSNTQGSEHVQIFWREKLKNVTQFVYLYLPLLVVAWRGRTPFASTLLAVALTFCAYHALFTMETMGHYSRFYMPAVVPIVAAAAEGWTRFQGVASRRFRWTFAVLWAGGYALLKVCDRRSGVYIYIPALQEVPFVCAIAMMVAPLRPSRVEVPSLAIAVLLLGTVLTYPLQTLRPERDRVILLRQIAPRPKFEGLPELAAIHPAHVYHTDMGAPGMLLGDATVTDLDGLLNEEMLLEHKSFTELCERDRPDAIFIPAEQLYPRLRAEILGSQCFRDYRADRLSRLAIRKDRLRAYHSAVAKAQASTRR